MFILVSTVFVESRESFEIQIKSTLHTVFENRPKSRINRVSGWLKMAKWQNSNATFRVIFKQCDYFKVVFIYVYFDFLRQLRLQPLDAIS